MNLACVDGTAAVYSPMFGVTTSDDYRPVAWIGRYPVRLISIIAGLYLFGMFATVVIETVHGDISKFVFQFPTFIHGAFWQPLTCTFVQTASFFFLFNILFLYWSGRELETFLGRRHFLQLFALLLLLPPVVISMWAAVGQNWIYFGSYEMSVGMFIAFAALYPNVELFGWVTLKWLAFAGIVLGSMQDLPQHAWGNLSVLWTVCLAGFCYIRFVQGRLALPANVRRISPFRRGPKLTIVQKSSTRRVVEPDDVYSSVDPILDKISKSGIGSLTDAERRQLDRARKQLLKKSE
jgi:hypothetical protein